MWIERRAGQPHGRSRGVDHRVRGGDSYSRGRRAVGADALVVRDDDSKSSVQQRRRESLFEVEVEVEETPVMHAAFADEARDGALIPEALRPGRQCDEWAWAAAGPRPVRLEVGARDGDRLAAAIDA